MKKTSIEKHELYEKVYKLNQDMAKAWAFLRKHDLTYEFVLFCQEKDIDEDVESEEVSNT